jgi:pimeloyl-ACP methyl ester carboxylesterase
VTLETLLEDLHETVLYVKSKYQRDKIVIFGHSWGTVLGILYAKRHPENVLCYIGAGQIVNMKRGEKLLFDRLKETSRGNAACSKKLRKLGDYPYNVTSFEEAVRAQKVISRVRKRVGLATDFSKVTQIARKSPVFGLGDLIAMLKSAKVNSKATEALLLFDTEAVIEYDTPVYFLHGTEDRQVPIELAQEYCQRIKAPDKGFYPLEAGHIINMDNLEGSIAVVRGILARVPQEAH